MRQYNLQENKPYITQYNIRSLLSLTVFHIFDKLKDSRDNGKAKP